MIENRIGTQRDNASGQSRPVAVRIGAGQQPYRGCPRPDATTAANWIATGKTKSVPMRIELTIEATEQSNRPPAIQRIKACLKSMLRSYGLRVVSAREVTTDSELEPVTKNGKRA